MRRLLFSGLLVICSPDAAWAHGAIPGIKGFYLGMLHPFTSGPQILALFALALVIQQRLPDGRHAFLGFLIGCIAGALVAAVGPLGFDPEVALIVYAGAAGALAASALGLPLFGLWSVGAIGGLLSGYVSWPDPGSLGDMLLTALGSIVGAVVVVVIVAGLIEMIWQAVRWAWLPVAIRVTGSWLAAISMLLGALLLRP